MATYDYNKANIVAERLHREIVDAGLPAPIGITHNPNQTPNNLHIEFSGTLTAPHETTLGTTDTNHVATAVTIPPALAPGGYVMGAKLTWGSVSTVKIGTVGKDSVVRDSTDELDIFWNGELTGDIVSDLDTGSEAADTWYDGQPGCQLSESPIFSQRDCSDSPEYPRPIPSSRMGSE